MSKKFYLTTPLYYVNGVPHVGHVYTSVIADAIARYMRLCGFEVCALTGTDEHGLKIERAARDQSLSPLNLANRNAAEFQDAWKNLDLHFDEFIRTTQKRHHGAVVEIFRRIEANGFIYQGDYTGNYCVNCEAYVPEGEKNCPDCGRPVELMTEESYFFRLSGFQEKLLRFYADNPDFVIPTTRMNEIISFVKGGLRDLSISRTSFTWGIPVPGNEKHIFYVWFDALTGYLSGIGFDGDPQRFETWWPADVQLIGKDILRFHAVYWPAFLIAAGLEPPRRILVNGWWTVDGEKMSKSRGNFITARELCERLEPDCIKYFLLREIPVGADGNFSYEGLVNRVNSDLSNDFGNLASRTLKMIENYFSAKVPERGEPGGGDDELVGFCRETVQLYRKNFARLQINRALDNIWELISAANRYLVANEPWSLAKDQSRRERLGTILYNAAEVLRILAIMLGPIIPDGAAAILKQLGIARSLASHRADALAWGGLKSGSPIGAVQAVYPRLDPESFQTPEPTAPETSVSRSPEPKAGASQERISIEDFARVEMRVGRVVRAERVPKSSKLLKLQVDVGGEVRQVVAGIGKAYEPESLTDRLVVVVTNLKPATLMGVESNGMIVAASIADRPVLVGFHEAVDPGARLK